MKQCGERKPMPKTSEDLEKELKASHTPTIEELAKEQRVEPVDDCPPITNFEIIRDPINCTYQIRKTHLEELAKKQGVEPVDDIKTLAIGDSPLDDHKPMTKQELDKAVAAALATTKWGVYHKSDGVILFDINDKYGATHFINRNKRTQDCYELKPIYPHYSTDLNEALRALESIEGTTCITVEVHDGVTVYEVTTEDEEKTYGYDLCITICRAVIKYYKMRGCA